MVLYLQAKDEIKKWGVWIVDELQLSGIRFDAVKHFSEDFLIEFIQHLANCSENFIFVGLNPPRVTISNIR